MDLQDDARMLGNRSPNKFRNTSSEVKDGGVGWGGVFHMVFPMAATPHLISSTLMPLEIEGGSFCKTSVPLQIG